MSGFYSRINNFLTFLNSLITRNKYLFTTSVHRKPSLTGLRTSSIICSSFNYEIKSIKLLINRGYNASSSFECFHNWLDFFYNYFNRNGYSLNLVDLVIKRFSCIKYDDHPTVVSDENDQHFFLALLWISILAAYVGNYFNLHQLY